MTVAAVLVAAAIGVLVAERVTEPEALWTPDYGKLDMGVYVAGMGNELSDDDYLTLLRQTGLGKDGVDSVLSAGGNASALFAEYQEMFFDPPEYTCFKVGIATMEEHFLDDEGKYRRVFQIADVRDGDILVTKGTHTLGWRHGHAGIVIDAERGKTLEAVFPGTPTAVQNLSKWRTFPSFIQLRHKDREIGDEAALIAAETFSGVPYSLLSGVFSKHDENQTTTQCAHLPWFAYLRLGYDLDSNGVWPVTPKDLANSGHLEIVQVFGVCPDALWN